jgi:hypothetical protein
LEARTPTDGEQLLRVGAVALATHGDRSVQIKFKVRLMTYGMAISTTGDIGHGGVGNL